MFAKGLDASSDHQAEPVQVQKVEAQCAKLTGTRQGLDARHKALTRLATVDVDNKGQQKYPRQEKGGNHAETSEEVQPALLHVQLGQQAPAESLSIIHPSKEKFS